MKKILLIILSVCLITGCTEKKKEESKKSEKNDTKINYKQKLDDVLKNKLKFIDSNNSKVLLNDYKLESEESVKVSEYTYLDLDNDSFEELIVKTDSNIGDYMIFHYQDNSIYGYVIGIRSFQNLKTDGTFVGSNGVQSQVYLTISFNKNEYTTNEKAINDKTNNIFKLNNQNVTQENMNKYVEDFNKKTDVIFNK